MNMQIPFFPLPPQVPKNLEEELIKIKQELANINERLLKLETTKKNNYMQKDDTLHMM